MVDMYDSQFDDEFEDEFEDDFEDDFDDDFDDTEGSEEDTTAPKKKSSFMFTAIIAIVVLLGGGFIAMQFMGGGAPAVPVEQAVTPTTDQQPENVAVEVDSAEIIAASVNRIEDMGAVVANDIMSPAENQDDFFNDFSDGSGVITPDVVIADNSVDVMDMTGMLDTGNVQDSVAVADPVVVVNAPEIAKRKVIAPVSVITNSLEDPKTLSRLDVFEDRLSNLENLSTTQNNSEPSASGGNSEDLVALRSEVKKLREDIKRLKRDTRVSIKSSPAKPRVGEVKAVSSAPVVKVKAKAMPAWVIRSAQPGKALLSSNTSNGTVSVKVGDVLSSLGSIRSIGINDKGLWEVKGTLSSVVER